MFTLKDGTPVITSTLQRTLYPEAYEVLQEVLSQIEPTDDNVIKTTIDLGRVVGNTICVSTTDEDEIVMKTRFGRENKTRFVIGRMPEPSTEVTVILSKRKLKYFVITAYIGSSGFKEVDDPKLKDYEREDSIKFWSNHALIYDEDIIID